MSTVHQFVPTLGGGAVGNHTLAVQRLLREHGFESEIFAAAVAPGMDGLSHDFRTYGRDFPARADDILMYQLAIGSVVGDFLRDRSETLVVNYHNLTPIHFFVGWDASEPRSLAWGRVQLRNLARRSARGITVSTYNAAEMTGVGYVDTRVVPILLDTTQFDTAVDERTLVDLERAKAAGGSDLLFVGRVSPNKCHHDLIETLAVYRKLYDPAARLHLVGGAGFPPYTRALEQFADELGLTDAVNITGSVDQGVLNAYYRSADAFVCLSEHEGFCVPILEAWHHELPVIGFAAAAIPETLGAAGLLLPTKSPETVAAALHHILSDPRLVDALTTRGKARLETFALERTQARMLDALSGLDAVAPSR